ncbi:MAG: hypothetical protein MAG451_00002 [Anaerolineales bacterium]|nr:hypothetical protein [Anaerolineales bacterium]
MLSQLRDRVAWVGWLRAVLAVAGVSLIYCLLQRGWQLALIPPSIPVSVLRRSIRVYFGVTLTVGTLLTPFVFRWANSRRALFLMRAGLLMTLAGLLGLWIYLPLTTTLNNAGGVVFDPGHTLSEAAPTGALWLFLCLAGWLPYLAGFREFDDYGRIEQIAFLFTLLVPLYLLLYLVVLTGYYITAP